ncbi:uncharacterized protein LOC142591307 [Dermacentor variabilis]|uniref:uncharacterized protein LOC142591307 n=1 Tax=Dermacentor variabilis TaxID=34621 RepID=UPI003F5C8D85
MSFTLGSYYRVLQCLTNKHCVVTASAFLFTCGPQEYPTRCCTTLRSALQKITSGTSITCSRSDCYCFYIPSPVASCWYTVLVSSTCTTTGSAFLFICGPQEYPTRCCATLRSALQKITSGTSITCSRSDCYCFYIPSPVASCWYTVLVSSTCTTTGSAFLFICGPQEYPTRCCTTLRSALQDYFGHAHLLFQERLLLLLDLFASGILLVDCTCLLDLHYYCFCTPLFNCDPQEFPTCCCTTLLSALQKITSGTSITSSRSDCYCFYIPSPVASCW